MAESPKARVSGCSIVGCNEAHLAKGLCRNHYARLRKGGTTELRGRPPPKEIRRVNRKGYVVIALGDKRQFEHILLAEKALGSQLPSGSQVHHVNENGSDNRGVNLVLCPDAAYHKLLHQRTRALEACGNPEWLSCKFCHQYAAPTDLYVSHSAGHYHRECIREYNRELKRRASGKI